MEREEEQTFKTLLSNGVLNLFDEMDAEDQFSSEFLDNLDEKKVGIIVYGEYDNAEDGKGCIIRYYTGNNCNSLERIGLLQLAIDTIDD